MVTDKITSIMSGKMRNLGGGPAQPQPQHRLFRRRTTNNDAETRFDIDTIGAFKMTPSFQPEHFMTNRPLMGACCSCMPRSQKDFVHSSLREMGMRNILDVKTELLNPGLIAKLFPTEVYAFNRPLFQPYSNLTRSVVTSPRVLNAIEETARQITRGDMAAIPKQIALLEKSCSKTMTMMRASVSSFFIKVTAWFLTKYLAKFLRSVQVCRGQMMMVKEASKRNVPMIYLPLHRSHLDYILVTLILWHYDIRAPFVAAGDNMNIPFFNLLMRWLGGFFIRRRLDSNRNKKDMVYRALLHEYMTKLLSQGEGLEFFIEGGRTRTGKSMIPKGGLLSVVVEAFNENEISDAFIVPIAFSYEKIIDGNYCREQMGLPKIKETFVGAVKAIFRVFFNTYGSVRVDFAQPFSLKEFMTHAKTYPYHPITLPTPPGRPSLDYGASYPNFSSTLLSTNGESENTRMLVKALADHVVYTSDHCTAPMATHLIAFLLLTKYRGGVYLRELTKSVHWIIRELQALRADVGFCGQSEDVILYAQKLLGKHLISKKWQEEDNDLKLYPNLTLPSVFELSYYANAVSTYFALESVLAVSILINGNLSLFHLLTTPTGVEKKVQREKVLEVAEEICTIIHNEYIFLPPCENLHAVLAGMLESFVSKEILSTEEADMGDELAFAGKDRRWADRLALSLDVDEEESAGSYVVDQYYQVNTERSDIRERLHFLVCILGPILEAHSLVAKFALEELHSEQPEEDFMRSLGNYARERVTSGLTLFSESCAMIGLKSAVKSLQDLEILYSYDGANLRMLGLSEQQDSRTAVEHYASLLETALS